MHRFPFSRQIADFQTKAEQQLFELDLKKRELRTAVEYATQDKEAADKMVRDRISGRDVFRSSLPREVPVSSRYL